MKVLRFAMVFNIENLENLILAKFDKKYDFEISKPGKSTKTKIAKLSKSITSILSAAE